jgi:hypothetical protein
MANIERLIGTGKVFIFAQQKFVADVQYDVQIHQNYSDGKTMEGSSRVPISAEVKVTITPDGAIRGYVGERLTLRLSDGRRQDFFVSSSRGDCIGTGGPY